MSKLTNVKNSRLFKKKLKLSSKESQYSKNVYLVWIDNSINKLFVAYDMCNKLIGMSCRIINSEIKTSNRCIFVIILI